MRLYFEFIKNAFQSNTAYRMDTIIRFFSRIIYILVWTAIWTALYASNAITDSRSGVISLKEMLTYVVLSTGVTIFISNNIIEKLDDKIRSGEIAADLIKPMKFKACLLCGTIGDCLYLTVFQLIPYMVVAALIFSINYPSWTNLLLFTISILNGTFIYYSISYLIGLIGFWYMSVWHLERLLEDAVRLLAGSVIPLWFFPNFLAAISDYLPFKLIYYSPIAIYLGKINLEGAYKTILLQVLWIVILLLIERVMWTKGIKKLVVQGG